MSVSAGRFHREAAAFTRCGQTCGTASATGRGTRTFGATGTANHESGTTPVDNDQDLATAWQRVVDELQPNQQAWVRASEPVTLHGNTAIIAVADDFTRTQLEGRLRGQLEDSLTAIFGHEIRLAVTVNAQLGDGAPRTRPSEPTSQLVDMSTDGHIDSLVTGPSEPA